MGTPDHNNWLPPAFASYEPHHDPGFDEPTVRHKDHPGVDQAHREPNPSNPQSYGTRRSATSTSSIRHLCAPGGTLKLSVIGECSRLRLDDDSPTRPGKVPLSDQKLNTRSFSSIRSLRSSAPANSAFLPAKSCSVTSRAAAQGIQM